MILNVIHYATEAPFPFLLNFENFLCFRWYIDDVLVLNRKNKLNLGAANKTWHNAKIGCKAKNKAGFSNTASTTLNVMCKYHKNHQAFRRFRN